MFDITAVPNAASVKAVQQRILASQITNVVDSTGATLQLIPNDLDIHGALVDADQLVNGSFYEANRNNI